MMEAHERHGEVVGHEERDVAYRPLALAGIGLIIVIIIVFIGVRALLGYYAERSTRTSPPPNPLASTDVNRLPPEPRLQTHPRRDLREQRALEDATLNTYGWVDRQNQIVRIPIDRAMELLAQQTSPPPAAPNGNTP